jgi:uncharacterized membrane protein YfcA
MLVIALAVIVGAVAKGITGLGLPVIAIPVVAAFLGVEQAVVIMAVPTFVTNLLLIREHRAYAGQTRHLPVMLTLGLIGTVLGTVFLTSVEPAVPAIVLGVLVLSYVGLRILQPSFAWSERTTAYTAPAVGFLGGALQGATGVSGPVIATYLHGFRLPREAFVLAATTVFQTFALVQIVTFIALGRYDSTNLTLTLAALVPAVIMLPIGIRLGRRLPTERLERILLLVLAASSVRLLYTGVTGIWG